MTCQSCEQETAGEYLCEACTTRVARQLTDLPPMYEALGAYLRPSSQVTTQVGTGGPAPHAPLPVREDALDLVGPGGMVAVLESWRQALYEDAELLWPQPFGDYTGRLWRAVRGLHSELGFIRRDWPQAGVFAQEVRELHGAARSVIAPSDRPVRAGTCTTVTAEGEVCGAVLLATPGNPQIRCRWCQAVYSPSSWLGLAAA